MSSKSLTESDAGSSFAIWKAASFALAKEDRRELGEKVGVNECHVQAKLPPDLYQQFWRFLKAKNFSKSTGVQYAIFQTLKNETNV